VKPKLITGTNFHTSILQSNRSKMKHQLINHVI